MKVSSCSATLTLVSLAFALSGCSGFQEASFPAVPAQNSVGTIQGSVFGGHAPIVNAHAFLLEATASGTASTGYAAMAKSLLSANSTATSGSYPVTEDTTAGSVTNGLYYVTSDTQGAFNISGDYSCDIGDPVYLHPADLLTAAPSSTSLPSPAQFRAAIIPTRLRQTICCIQARAFNSPPPAWAASGPR